MPAASVERVEGIEPSYAAWEAAILPLNYTRDSRSSNRFHHTDAITDCQSGKPLQSCDILSQRRAH